MQVRIVSGGTTHVMGGRASTFAIRANKWNQLDPERVRGDMLGTTTRREQLSRLIKISEIAGDMTQFMRKTHQALCEYYCKKIKGLVGPLEIGRRPDTAEARRLDFHILSDESPGPNYTDEMHLLKNMRFLDWTPNQQGSPKLLGFCHLEPQVRFLQLLEFPIEKFVLEMPNVQWPGVPSSVSETRVDFSRADAIDQFMPELENWEQYYIKLAESMVELRKMLETD